MVGMCSASYVGVSVREDVGVCVCVFVSVCLCLCVCVGGGGGGVAAASMHCQHIQLSSQAPLTSTS